MEPKEEVYKIKVTDAYSTTVIKKLHCDANIDEMMQAWRDIMLAMGFPISGIDEYIEPN